MADSEHRFLIVFFVLFVLICAALHLKDHAVAAQRKSADEKLEQDRAYIREMEKR